MKLPKIKNLVGDSSGFAKLFTLIILIIIMVMFAVPGVNRTPGVADNSRSQTQPSEITVGKTIHANLDDTDIKLKSGQSFDEYTFEGIGGEAIVIGLSTFDFDGFLWLLDKEGKVIEINDDNGDGMGSIISKFFLPDTGKYTIWVSSHGAGESGAYTLTLNEAPSIDSPQAIAIGDKVKGNLNGSSPRFSTGQFYEAYTFEASHWQAISIVMDASRVDTYLWLLDKEGRVITVNDNARTSGKKKGRSEIIFLPIASDTYTVLASSSAPMEKGKYQLRIDTLHNPPAKAENLSGTVPGNLQRSDFQLNGGQYLDVYSFCGEIGQNVTLGLSSSDVDSYLRILDKQGNVIKVDNNSGFQRDAMINNFTLPETGKYYVWVSSVFAGERGDYELSFNDDISLSQQEFLYESDTGAEPCIKIIYGKSGSCGGCGGDAAIEGAGKQFTNPYRCVGSTTPYTAYVDICSSGSLSSSVNLSGPAGIVINPASLGFSVNNSCTNVSSFSITCSGASAGTHLITATVPGLGSDSENMYVLGLTSQTVSTTPADRTRTTIGIGEQVTVSVTPVISVNWSVTGGGAVNPGSGTSTTFTASKSSSTSTIHAVVGGTDCTLVFSVIAPTGMVYYHSTDDTTLGTLGPPNNQIGARSRFTAEVQPTTVSFSNVEFRKIVSAANWTWPDGTPGSSAQQTDTWSASADNTYSNYWVSSGLNPIGRIHNGASYVDYSYSVNVNQEYKNESGTWIGFASQIHINQYRGADQKARVRILTSTFYDGGWMGPWQ